MKIKLTELFLVRTGGSIQNSFFFTDCSIVLSNCRSFCNIPHKDVISRRFEGWLERLPP